MAAITSSRTARAAWARLFVLAGLLVIGDNAQGYYFSRPLPADEATHPLLENAR